LAKKLVDDGHKLNLSLVQKKLAEERARANEKKLAEEKAKLALVQKKLDLSVAKKLAEEKAKLANLRRRRRSFKLPTIKKDSWPKFG